MYAICLGPLKAVDTAPPIDFFGARIAIDPFSDAPLPPAEMRRVRPYRSRRTRRRQLHTRRKRTTSRKTWLRPNPYVWPVRMGASPTANDASILPPRRPSPLNLERRESPNWRLRPLGCSAPRSRYAPRPRLFRRLRKRPFGLSQRSEWRALCIPVVRICSKAQWHGFSNSGRSLRPWRSMLPWNARRAPRFPSLRQRRDWRHCSRIVQSGLWPLCACLWMTAANARANRWNMSNLKRKSPTPEGNRSELR